MKLTEGGRSRYFGESSGQHLFRTAEVFKNQHEGQNVPEQSRHIRRAQFWRSPWEKTASYHPPVYTFPPQDLMDSLVAIYFRHWNIFIPLLHRPTFQRAIASGLHLTDHSFGSVALGVCALGARLSDDPRVILPGTNSTLSAGWEWLQQIQVPRRP
ncbi:hypothetical protein C8F01DRAFT_725505 [Mycena amicta]|nr:hypothetical protein C8F01DRAFT_725505 [Mycena amicta]